jgi:hypothetical protein
LLVVEVEGSRLFDEFDCCFIENGPPLGLVGVEVEGVDEDAVPHYFLYFFFRLFFEEPELEGVSFYEGRENLQVFQFLLGRGLDE